MMVQHKFITLEGSRLTYLKTGEGNHAMITLHGFGQNASDLQVIEKAYPGYRFYHINLFFHDSYLHASYRPLKQERWLEIVAKLLEEENIENFSLAGFSIGCRLIYPVSEIYGNRVEKIILLAPEGENLSLWYRAAVSFFPSFFKYMVFRPAAFFSIINLMVKLKLLKKSVARFAKSQMKSRNKRWQVYMTWIHFRLLRFNLKKWAQVMNLHQVPVIIFTGENDQIIPAVNAKAIYRKLKKVTHYHIKSGHQDLLKRSTEFLLGFNK